MHLLWTVGEVREDDRQHWPFPSGVGGKSPGGRRISALQVDSQAWGALLSLVTSGEVRRGDMDSVLSDMDWSRRTIRGCEVGQVSTVVGGRRTEAEGWMGGAVEQGGQQGRATTLFFFGSGEGWIGGEGQGCNMWQQEGQASSSVGSRNSWICHRENGWGRGGRQRHIRASLVCRMG